MTDAPERIKAYINTRSKHPKLDQDEIHALDAGTDREAFLRLSDVKAILDLHDAQAARIAELEGVLLETLIDVDKLGNHCVGCGHMCGDPEKDLAMIRKAGGISCCPERKMEPISSTLVAMVPALTTLKGTTNDT